MLDKVFQTTGNTLTIGSVSLTFSISSIIEILIFSVAIYYVILWIKRTKAWTLLKGAGLLLAVYLLAKLLSLNNIAFLFEKAVSSIVIAAIVILQPELRKALEHLGDKSFLRSIFHFSGMDSSEELTAESVDAIVRALSMLGKNKTGALIVIEQNIDLTEFIETGIQLDAKISAALLEQIFEHNTPLHDGAVIIRRGRIVAATCYLPLSQNDQISKDLGTRHRAGLGISEVADCITLIASEETGALSVAMDGQLKHNTKSDEIRNILMQLHFAEDVNDNKEKLNLSDRIRLWRERRKHEE